MPSEHPGGTNSAHTLILGSGLQICERISIVLNHPTNGTLSSSSGNSNTSMKGSKQPQVTQKCCPPGFPHTSDSACVSPLAPISFLPPCPSPSVSSSPPGTFLPMDPKSYLCFLNPVLTCFPQVSSWTVLRPPTLPTSWNTLLLSSLYP